MLRDLKPRERTSIINALKAGVVPPVGLRHMQVGRAEEIAGIIKDLDHISSGAAAIRFIIGDFGSGKSFFLTLCKLMAHEKKMVVMNADITTHRILCSSDGKAKALYTELIKNMSCKSRPEGNGLKFVLEAWIGQLKLEYPHPTENNFYQSISTLSDLSLSGVFAKVLFKYYTAYTANDAIEMEKCLRWIRGEYNTRTESHGDVGINVIIQDNDFYNMIKLLAAFSRKAGFTGLVVNIDEIAVLIRLRKPIREKNYENLLTIINDCLQGNVEGLCFLFGATTDSIENEEKGLYSYGALQTRLASNAFATSELKDFTGPVMKLQVLSKEEIFVLLTKLHSIYINLEGGRPLIDEEGTKAFFIANYSYMGAEQHLTPRDLIKRFVDLLSVLEANPSTTWRKLILATPPEAPVPEPTEEFGDEEDLVTLKFD